MALEVFGQNSPIKGQIIDKVSNEPIPFAHVYLLDLGTGTISGKNGEFLIPQDKVNSTKQIKFSAIGYQTLVLYIAEITDVVYLLPEEIALKTFTVYGDEYAYNLVSQCIENIPLNYPQNKEVIRGIQAEMVSKEGNFKDPSYIAEAKIEIFKNPYPSNVPYQDRIIESKVYFGSSFDELVTTFYSDNPSSFNYDLIYKQSGPLNKKKIKNYILKVIGSYEINNEEIIIIEFTPFKANDYHGELHISEKSKALISAKYIVYNKPVIYQKNTFSSPEIYYSIEVNYKNHEGIYRINDFTYLFNFHKNGKKWTLKDVFFSQEILKESQIEFFPQKNSDNVYFLSETQRFQTDDWDGFLTSGFSKDNEQVKNPKVCIANSNLFKVGNNLRADFGIAFLNHSQFIDRISFNFNGTEYSSIEINQSTPLIALKQSILYQIHPKITIGFSTWNSFKRDYLSSYFVDFNYHIYSTQLFSKPINFTIGSSIGFQRKRFNFREPNQLDFSVFLEQNGFQLPYHNFFQKNGFYLSPTINLEYRIWKKGSLIFGLQNNQVLHENFRIHFREKKYLFPKLSTNNVDNLIFENSSKSSRNMFQHTNYFLGYRLRFL
ncbi:MAG: carboxypeptidase-like regulatory domain-containing protein [Flavobacterium sp.]